MLNKIVSGKVIYPRRPEIEFCSLVLQENLYTTYHVNNYFLLKYFIFPGYPVKKKIYKFLRKDNPKLPECIRKVSIFSVNGNLTREANI